jgi:hypothetical protein
MFINNACSCPNCEKELRMACMSPEFCKPCCIKEKSKVKLCSICKSEYAVEYNKCPTCVSEKSNI